MVSSDRVLQLIKEKGPLIPSDISKDLGQNIIITSAILSELADKNQIKISSVKVGGSPLYYVSEQAEKLQNYASNLHEKEKKAFDLLMEKKILLDTDLEPVIRVALRNIKDFAKPLQVTFADQTSIFWKWYSISDEEASILIGQIVNPQPVEQKPEPVHQDIEDKPKPLQPATPKPSTEDTFLEMLKTYFEKNNISIREIRSIKKNKEIDFVLSVPSPLGDMTYYAKAKNNKRISDNDISNCFAQGQVRKLPSIILFTGELSKKAIEAHKTEFTSVVAKKI